MCFTPNEKVVNEIAKLVKAKSRSQSELINLILTAVLDDEMFMKVALKEVSSHGKS